WINEIKFPREILPQYYNDYFEPDSPIQFPLTYPGDYFDNKQFQKISEYHSFKSEKEIYSNLDDLYKDEIAIANSLHLISNEVINLLIESLKFWLNKNKSLYHADVINDLMFSIKL